MASALAVTLALSAAALCVLAQLLPTLGPLPPAAQLALTAAGVLGGPVVAGAVLAALDDADGGG